MPRWTVVLPAALLSSALVFPALAQWKWRDQNGRAQYSDLPPPAGVADKDILQRPAAAQRLATSPTPAASAASAGASAARATLVPKAVEPELEAKRKLAEQAEADKRKAEEAKVAAAKADNCSRARVQLRTMESGQRIARVNDKGEREILEDSARADETRRANEAIAGNCR